MTAKAVCLRIKVAQLKSFVRKTTGILQYSEVFYILRGGLKVTRAETGNYFLFILA